MQSDQAIQLTEGQPKALPQSLVDQVDPTIATMRKLAWAYFILLLMEGALRKWIFPTRSEELLLVRDPILLLIYYLAYNAGIFPLNTRNRILFALGFASIPFAIFSGGFNPASILYGIRTNCLHFPLIFLLPRIFTYRDVIRAGLIIICVSPFMTYIVINQFQATPDDPWNTAAGGTGRQLETSGGKVRASGTFSFVSGVVFYYAFLIAFVIIGFLRNGSYHKILLWVGVICSILAIATSGSRAVVASAVHVLACFGFLATYNPRAFGSAFGLIVSLLIAFFILGRTPVYQEGMRFLRMRFDEASNVEGGAVAAYFHRNKQIIISPIRDTLNADLFGKGIGAGTNVGIRLGAPKAFYGENEWQRHILESGPILGNLFILWRVSLAFFMLQVCIQAVKRGNYLPIFLWGAVSHIILWGPAGQPTTLGFAAFGGGLCLAAIRRQQKTHSLDKEEIA